MRNQEIIFICNYCNINEIVLVKKSLKSEKKNNTDFINIESIDL